MEYNSGIIRRVISKSTEREAWGRFEIASPINPWILRHEVQLLINRNYNKIQEEYDSGIFKLFERLIYSTSKLDAEKEPIPAQLAQAWWHVLSYYSGMTCASVQLRLKSGLLMTNQIREFWYSYDYSTNQINSNQIKCWSFWWEGKTGVPGAKPLIAE